MERRDLLKDQIEQLGKVLALMLGDFLGLKSSGNVEEAVETSQETLKSEMDIDLTTLISLNGDDLKSYLVERKIAEPHFEILAEYLAERGKVFQDEKESLVYFDKALELIQIADGISQTMCFNRFAKKQTIEALRKELVEN